MRRGFDFTMSKEMTNEMQEMIKTKGTNERMGDEPQAQDNKSKLIQAKKTLERRDRVLTAAIRRCHVELAKKESLRDIEASKDAVEAAWNEYNQAIGRYCMYAGADSIGRKDFEEQPEEACRALYEWKVLTDMMEQVVDKAEEYLESATKENSKDELYDDEDGGNELDAEVEVRLWMEQLSIMSKVNEMALEVSTVNKVNEVALEVSNVNEESNVNEVNVSEVNMNEVNDESTVNEACCIARNIKEVAPGVVPYSMIKEVELHMAHNVQVESGAEVQVEQNGAKVQVEQNGDKFDEVKSDVNVEAKVEVFGMKEKVMHLDGLTMMKVTEQSRCANWDPGELLDAKDQMEMLNVEEVTNLLNDDKVAGSGDVKAIMLFYALCNWMFHTSDALVALCMARFVNGFRRECPIELSDYG